MKDEMKSLVLQDMVMRRASKIPDLQNLSEPRTHAPPPLTRSISHMAFTTPTEKVPSLLLKCYYLSFVLYIHFILFSCIPILEYRCQC